MELNDLNALMKNYILMLMQKFLSMTSLEHMVTSSGRGSILRRSWSVVCSGGIAVGSVVVSLSSEYSATKMVKWAAGKSAAFERECKGASTLCRGWPLALPGWQSQSGKADCWPAVYI
uniref:Uncharacterized protein n=1 Tax=Timema douglasi TaxID=61478 RepID=A0A7R8VUC0_TIMDO|nr:unnamed protein product [Timema douglasi]